MQYYLSEIPQKTNFCKLEGEEGHHLVRVKRCNVGEMICLFDGKGFQVSAKVVEILKNSAILEILERKFSQAPAISTVLFVVPPKGKNFSLILEKAVELGVDEIVPVFSSRAVKEYQSEKEEKYEKILLEASKQCERPFLPKLKNLCTLEESIYTQTSSNDLRLFFHTSGGGKIQELFTNRNSFYRCCYWIGPEGGWTDSEIELIKASKLNVCTLSTPILRVETAVIAITGMIKMMLDS